MAVVTSGSFQAYTHPYCGAASTCRASCGAAAKGPCRGPRRDTPSHSRVPCACTICCCKIHNLIHAHVHVCTHLHLNPTQIFTHLSGRSARSTGPALRGPLPSLSRMGPSCVCTCAHVCVCVCVCVCTCVHVCVCMCVCACVQVCVCAHGHANLYMRMCVLLCAYTCMCVHVHVCVRARVCCAVACVCVHACVWACVWVCVGVHVRARMRECTCKHVHVCKWPAAASMSQPSQMHLPLGTACTPIPTEHLLLRAAPCSCQG